MRAPCVKGHYEFLPGIAPFSSGVVAGPGYQVVHVTLRRSLPYRQGFERIDSCIAVKERQSGPLASWLAGRP